MNRMKMLCLALAVALGIGGAGTIGAQGSDESRPMAHWGPAGVREG